MPDFMIGLKVYSLDWYWKYGLDYRAAAAELKALGVSYIITMSRFLPMSNSAVDSEIPSEKAHLLNTFDDLKFKDALKDQGIEYFGACNMFFDPVLIRKHGNIPVDSHGDPARQIDWYFGGCPTDEAYVEEQISKIEHAMRKMNMDGVFLGFMRFPGFWELWLPGTKRKEWPEYCFCHRCIEKFQKHSGIRVPAVKAKGEWIKANCYDAFVDFKTTTITNIVGEVRARIRAINPGAKIVLNTVPFDTAHYDNAGIEVFAQDPRRLSEVVDIFEVMGYHQILGRPMEWIAKTGLYFKKLTGQKVVCTVQVQPLYITGMHAGKGRSETITPEEFGDTLQSIKEAGLDGAAVFTWSDFLEQQFEKHDFSYLDQIKTR